MVFLHEFVAQNVGILSVCTLTYVLFQYNLNPLVIAMCYPVFEMARFWLPIRQIERQVTKLTKLFIYWSHVGDFNGR